FRDFGKKPQPIQQPTEVCPPKSHAEDERDILPIPTNPKHQALAHVFRYKRIPVVSPQSAEIDWSRVQLGERSGSPTLRFCLAGVPRVDIALTTVRTIVLFLRDFKKFYEEYLTILFEDLAWKYMSKALRPSGLMHQYEHAIKRFEEKKRNWTAVEKCIHDIFKLSVMQAE
ncbi:hypothetical protein BGX34_008676, partial [Mortierella sp. NVP85]